MRRYGAAIVAVIVLGLAIWLVRRAGNALRRDLKEPPKKRR